MSCGRDTRPRLIIPAAIFSYRTIKSAAILGTAVAFYERANTPGPDDRLPNRRRGQFLKDPSMFREMLDNEEFIELRRAYDQACEDLGLGATDKDLSLRERLAVLMLSLAKGGDRDLDVIRTQAVDQLQR